MQRRAEEVYHARHDVPSQHYEVSLVEERWSVLEIEKERKRQNMKKLFKSNVNKKLCGVCGGIGEYFNVDPTIVRLIFVILGLWSGSGVILYIIAALLIPDEGI